MKKLFAIILSAVFLLSLSACGNNNTGSMMENDGTSKKDGNVASSIISDISDDINDANMPDGTIDRDRALEIALSHAKLEKDNVHNIDVDFDRERNGYQWEVDFDYEGHEYSYDIDAKTGEIIHNKKEVND